MQICDFRHPQLPSRRFMVGTIPVVQRLLIVPDICDGFLACHRCDAVLIQRVHKQAPFSVPLSA